jgi:hypothetical protein
VDSDETGGAARAGRRRRCGCGPAADPVGRSTKKLLSQWKLDQAAVVGVEVVPAVHVGVAIPARPPRVSRSSKVVALTLNPPPVDQLLVKVQWC